MKISLYISVFIFFSFIISVESPGQDILYKKDGSTLIVKIISSDSPTITYQIPGDSAGYIHYISKSALDSLRFSKGTSLLFPYKESPVPQIKRNYIGTDMYNTLLGNLNLSFERMSVSGNKSIIAGVHVNINPDEAESVMEYWHFWDNWYITYHQYYFFIRLGVNYYPFNYSLARSGYFRLSAGPSVIIGSYRKGELDEYYTEVHSKAFAAGVIWNVSEKLYLSDAVQIKFGADISVIPLFVFCVPRIGLTIAF